MSAFAALPRTVWLLGAISLLNDAASELVYPLIPLYLASVLSAGPRALGLIEGAAEAASALLKLASGVWYDRVRKAKGFVVAGYALAALSRPLIAVVGAWPALLGLRVMDRVGKGLRSSPRDALLAHSVDSSRRGLAFGVHRAFDNAGAVIGPLAAAALLAIDLPLQTILLGSAIPGVLCVALALAIREPEVQRLPVSRKTIRAAAPAADWRWVGLPPAFRRTLQAVAIFTLGQASYAFFILRASDLGMPPAQVALLWAAVAATSALLAVPLSSLSDRVGRIPLLTLGWTVHAVLFVLLGWANLVSMMWVAALLLGLTMAATEGSERALIADLVAPGALGTAFGWYYLTKGVLLLPASAFFGLIWQVFGARAAFSIAAALVALATLVLVTWVLPIVGGSSRAARV